MPYTSHGDLLYACDKLLAAAKSLSGQPAADELSQQLDKVTIDAREAQARKNLHKAAAQQASRDFDLSIEIAKGTFSRLRHMLIALFGLKAEKLIEFGFQPFRPSRTPRKQRVKQALEMEKPPEIGVTPAQAASSQTASTT